MKISSNQIHQITRVYLQDRAAKVNTPRPALGEDSVSLSVQGKEAQAIRQKLAETPDVRDDKVDELKAAIRSGNYRVTGKDVADRILSRVLADVLINRGL